MVRLGSWRLKCHLAWLSKPNTREEVEHIGKSAHWIIEKPTCLEILVTVGTSQHAKLRETFQDVDGQLQARSERQMNANVNMRPNFAKQREFNDASTTLTLPNLMNLAPASAVHIL